MKPAAPAARAPPGRDAAGAGHQQHARGRRLGAQALADLRPRLAAEEQVHERDVRLVAPAHARAPRRPCGRSGSARPTTSVRASAESPSARRRDRRRRAPAGAWPGVRAHLGRSGPRGAPASVPGSASPYSSTPSCWSASSVARRRPTPRRRPVAGAAPRRARDAVVAHLEHERAAVLAQRDASPRVAARVLVRVAHRLHENRLGERLEACAGPPRRRPRA